jgi:hypothetical protein
MTLSHNSIIRGFNSIYQQAPRIGVSSNKDFIAYCLAWQKLVHTHHYYEEIGFFPAIEEATGQKGIMDSAVNEHGKSRNSSHSPHFRDPWLNKIYTATFHDGLEQFKTYLESLTLHEEDFSASELLKIMDSFSTALHAHLATEPDQIADLARFSTPEKPIDIEKIAAEIGKKQVTLDFALNVMPIFFLNMEFVEFEGGMWMGKFPPVPAPVK